MSCAAEGAADLPCVPSGGFGPRTIPIATKLRRPRPKADEFVKTDQERVRLPSSNAPAYPTSVGRPSHSPPECPTALPSPGRVTHPCRRCPCSRKTPLRQSAPPLPAYRAYTVLLNIYTNPDCPHFTMKAWACKSVQSMIDFPFLRKMRRFVEKMSVKSQFFRIKLCKYMGSLSCALPRRSEECRQILRFPAAIASASHLFLTLYRIKKQNGPTLQHCKACP